ncbi:MAG: integration host factor subunit beta [Prevotellaceae bacterium]|jgi:DNA-binding protein HU-beta|nr:integration host factor subunit beta [Prevotellaceae bacterium]
MTKAEIVKEISKHTGIEGTVASVCVEAFIDTVKEALVEGNNVYLRGFGSFIIKQRARKTARNITQNTTIIVPPRQVPAFKPSKTFIQSVSKELK